jgi:signal transduction histidine kinase/DNA-binding response OmpR family regulator
MLLSSTSKIYGQYKGQKYLSNYSYKVYDHQPQNWAVLQAKNGIIYVANNGGILEFDGVSWQVIKVPGYNTVRSLAIDETGTIFIGGINKIGYLAPDSRGSLSYISLLDHLDNNQRNFSVVWKTYATENHVYFFTSSELFRWEPAQKKMVVFPHTYTASISCGNNIYFRDRKTGLEKMVQKGEMKNGSITESHELKTLPIRNGVAFANKKVYMITQYGDNNSKLLIGTFQHGLYLHDGKTTVPFSTEVDNILKKNKIIHGIRLSSGNFAVATALGGLMVITPGGRLKDTFNKASGLQDDMVYHVFEDTRGNLWLCLSKGVSKIEYASPLSLFDERSQLTGLILSIARHGPHLYVGTVRGLYVLDSPNKFSLMHGLYGYCWDLESRRDSLLAATSNGVFQVTARNGEIRRVIKEKSFVLLPSAHIPGRTWCGTNLGVAALSEKNGHWLEEYQINGIHQGIKSIVEDKNGELWLGTTAGEVLKVDVSSEPEHHTVTRYDASHGLPEGGVNIITSAAGHVIFATGKGILRFQQNSKRFIPDNTLGEEFANGSRPVFRIVEDKNRNIWFHSESANYRATPGNEGNFTVLSKTLRRIPRTAQVNVIYPDPDGKNIWFGSIDGLIRYDTSVENNNSHDFKTLLRKVHIDGRLIFGGNKTKIGFDTSPAYIIDYKNRNLHFEFAAPFFEAENETRYRCFLEGYDGRWPAWNKDTKRNYTNLDAGIYTFRVQARNVYLQPGTESLFQFEILPPWYKTWWAFGIYAAAFIMTVFLIVKWQSGKLEREKKRLEQIVKERTKEINEKNQQLESQTLKLQDQSEKLKEMDKTKSRFFANISHEFRTPLTLIMGPLERMLTQNHHRDGGKELQMMLRNSQRLLRLINRLLDLSKLDGGKMKLNLVSKNIIPTIKTITAGFESLALQNQVSLILKIEEEKAILSFDSEKIEEVLCNLLINALKFTPPGGQVVVSTQRGDTEISSFPNGYLELSIRDTGVGIPRNKLAHIFDRFYQTDDSRQSRQQGSGIGLALTKELVLLHQGKIDVHSSGGNNSGTEFVIRLPMGAGYPQSAQKEQEPETGFDHSKTTDRSAQYAMECEEIDADETTPEAAGKNGKDRDKNIVLVVEDNADVRKYIRGPLEPQYSVIEAKNGREGIEKAKEIIPDLIVSDIMMPEADGYELCRILKKDVKTSHIPIILLTAKASDQSVIEGLETGADDYITKPFNTRILVTRIKNLIELRLHLQQKIQKQMLLQPAEISVSSVDQEFIEELQQVIEANLSDSEFHVEALSNKLYMNRVTLYRKVRALTGETPTQFIRSYRLKRAAQLLRDNAGNVSQIAIDVGFSNLGYFTRCFKEKFQQLPSTYQASEA